MHKALFFDFDGVLFDLEPVHYLSWQQTLIKLGHQDLGLTLKDVIGISDWELGEAFIKKFHLKLTLDDLLDIKRQVYQKLLPSYSFNTTELTSILTQLKNHYTLFIVSSSHTEEIRQILNRQNLLPFFTHIIGGDSVKQHKPNPEPYLLALKISNLPPSQVLAIEDSEAGLTSATAAGLKVIWLNTYHYPVNAFYKPFPTCNSFSELPSLIHKLL